METKPFTDLIVEEVTKDPASFAQRIQRTWEDRNQFEEMVQTLLNEHERNKPRDVFY